MLAYSVVDWCVGIRLIRGGTKNSLNNFYTSLHIYEDEKYRLRCTLDPKFYNSVILSPSFEHSNFGPLILSPFCKSQAFVDYDRCLNVSSFPFPSFSLKPYLLFKLSN